MQNLFENAVQSIQLGVEDFKVHKPARALSAVRNFYAGLLLLAKEVLVRKVPNADESEVIAQGYRPVPDDSGGVKYVRQSKRTIDLATIGDRFRDFRITIDQKALKELSDIRNDIEHLYPKVPHDSVRQALAKAFPVAAELFRLAGEEPRKVIGEAWETMLEVRAVYDQERNACRATFGKVEWRSPILGHAPLICPECRSELVAQDDLDNRDQEDVKALCRSCGASINAEVLIETAVEAHLKWQSYVAMTDGDVAPLQHCPECGLATYILSEEEIGCVWCEFTLNDKCSRCHTPLMPDDVDFHNYNLCSYCGYLLAKDD